MPKHPNQVISWNRVDYQLLRSRISLDRNPKNCLPINAFNFRVRNLIVSMLKWHIHNGTVLETKIQCVLKQSVWSHFGVDAVACDLVENAFLHVPEVQCWLRRHDVMSLSVVLECLQKEDWTLVLEISELLLPFLLCFLFHFPILSNY